MTIDASDQLATLIQRDREVLLANWRTQVRLLPSVRLLDAPTLNDHIPDLLDEVIVALRAQSEGTTPEALREGSPPAHGLQRVPGRVRHRRGRRGDNILRGCIHDLAEQNGLRMRGDTFHTINRVFNEAIGLAVHTFAAQAALEVQKRREEYLAFATHDLRTPLNAISLASRVLDLTLVDQSAATSRMLKALHRNVEQLADLVRKIIEENVNIETESDLRLQRRAFDLWPLVESLIHDLHPVAWTDSTRLVNEVPDDLVVYADASLLRRVLQNLIANAIKYTPRGEIIIGARELGDDGTIEGWVSDNGVGIPDELLAKVFNKGETDPDSAVGLGLGLAIVKTFMEAHGGTVSVESEKDFGSTFRYTLPGTSGSLA